MSTSMDSTDVPDTVTDTTMTDQTTANGTTASSLPQGDPNTTDTAMKDSSAANDVPRSASATGRPDSKVGGSPSATARVSMVDRQDDGQCGSDKSSTPKYTTQPEQTGLPPLVAPEHSGCRPSSTQNVDQIQQEHPITPDGFPASLQQSGQEIPQGTQISDPVDTVMAGAPMDWATDLNLSINPDDLDFGDAPMADLRAMMATVDEAEGDASQVPADAAPAGNMENIFAGISDLEAGILPMDLLFSKLNALPLDKHMERSEADIAGTIPTSIFGNGLESGDADELLQGVGTSQMDIDVDCTHCEGSLQATKRSTEIPDSQMEGVDDVHNSATSLPRQEADLCNQDTEFGNQNTDLPNNGKARETQGRDDFRNPASPRPIEASKSSDTKHSFEIPDSQMDVDPMVATPVSPAEESESSNVDEDEKSGKPRSTSPTGYSDSSDEDMDAVGEPQRTAAWDLRFSTLTNQHPAASSWVDKDETGDYDPKEERRQQLRERKRNSRKKAKAKSASDEGQSQDDEMPDTAPDATQVSGMSADELSGDSVPIDVNAEIGSGEQAGSLASSAKVPEKAKQSSETSSSALRKAKRVYPKQATVLQHLRRHDGEICFICFPKFRLFGERGGYKGKTIPICGPCTVARFKIMTCRHDKIRKIPDVEETKPDFKDAKARAMAGKAEEADIWCSLCCDLAEHRCKTVEKEGEPGGCGLALCIQCSHTLRHQCAGSLHVMLEAMGRGEAGRREHGWRTDALLLDMNGVMSRFL